MIRFEYGRLYPLYASLVIFGMAGGPVLLFIKYLKFQGIKKLQTLLVLIGFLLTAIFGIVTNVFLQDKVSVEVFRLGNYGAIFLIVFTSYAIIRHHLFDIRVVIQRGVIYSTLLGIIIGLYVFLVFIIGFFFQQATDATILLAAGITTIIRNIQRALFGKIFPQGNR